MYSLSKYVLSDERERKGMGLLGGVNVALLSTSIFSKNSNLHVPTKAVCLSLLTVHATLFKYNILYTYYLRNKHYKMLHTCQILFDHRFQTYTKKGTLVPK